MTHFLQYVFSSFWVFLGTEALIMTVGAALAMPFQFLKRNNISVFNNGEKETEVPDVE